MLIKYSTYNLTNWENSISWWRSCDMWYDGKLQNICWILRLNYILFCLLIDQGHKLQTQRSPSTLLHSHWVWLHIKDQNKSDCLQQTKPQSLQQHAENHGRKPLHLKNKSRKPASFRKLKQGMCKYKCKNQMSHLVRGCDSVKTDMKEKTENLLAVTFSRNTEQSRQWQTEYTHL